MEEKTKSTGETLGQKLKKFLSVKWWGFVISVAVLTLVAIYGDLNIAFTSGLVAIYGVMVAGNSVAKSIRSSNEQRALTAKVATFLKSVSNE